MVRPRASERNLSIATAFGTIVVFQENSKSWRDEMLAVTCNGQRSIFAALCECLPELARDSSDKKPKNRQGVTEIELNKSLQV